MKKHLSAGADLNKSTRDELPLSLALNRRQWDVVSYLLRKKPDVTRTQADGDTALHIAVENRASESLLKTILRLEADINSVNEFGQSPLSLAARAPRHVGPDISGGMTALLYAAREGHLDTVRALVMRVLGGEAQPLSGVPGSMQGILKP